MRYRATGSTPSTSVNFASAATAARERLFLQCLGPRDDFDIVIVGSGIGGGVLADDLADRLGGHKRILVLEAGSFVYPTHVYNVCRFPNASLARHFGCDTFWQAGDQGSERYIGEKPQLKLRRAPRRSAAKVSSTGTQSAPQSMTAGWAGTRGGYCFFMAFLAVLLTAFFAMRFPLVVCVRAEPNPMPARIKAKFIEPMLLLRNDQLPGDAGGATS